MRPTLLLALLACLCHAPPAAGNSDRAAILDAIRPVAARMVRQAVRIRVDRLNQDKGWAVLVGELVGVPGKAIDWKLSEACDSDLDKMLWVVLERTESSWQVRHIEVCAPEPPYWYLEQYGGLVWPCGVYAGLQSSEGNSLEKQCRASRQRGPERK